MVKGFLQIDLRFYEIGCQISVYFLSLNLTNYEILIMWNVKVSRGKFKRRIKDCPCKIVKFC